MDVSHYDGTIDWVTAQASGITFAFVKATESTDFVDPTFATNWAGMKGAGVVRGAYHFFHADVDPVAQANFVTKTVGTLEAGDLPIVLDLETTNGESQSTIIANATTFLATVTATTGLPAMLYVSPSFLSDYSSFVGNPLWVANWAVKCPDVPAPWSTWTFWQTSATGTVSGVPSPSSVDLDTFNGTLAELHALGVGGSVDAGSGTDAAAKSDSAPGNPDSGTSPTEGGTDATAPMRDAGTPLGNPPEGGSGGGAGGGGSFSDRQTGGCTVGAGPADGSTCAFSFLLLAMLAASSRARRAQHTRS